MLPTFDPSTKENASLSLLNAWTLNLFWLVLKTCFFQFRSGLSPRCTNSIFWIRSERHPLDVYHNSMFSFLTHEEQWKKKYIIVYRWCFQTCLIFTPILGMNSNLTWPKFLRCVVQAPTSYNTTHIRSMGMIYSHLPIHYRNQSCRCR